MSYSPGICESPARNGRAFFIPGVLVTVREASANRHAAGESHYSPGTSHGASQTMPHPQLPQHHQPRATLPHLRSHPPTNTQPQQARPPRRTHPSTTSHPIPHRIRTSTLLPMRKPHRTTRSVGRRQHPPRMASQPQPLQPQSRRTPPKVIPPHRANGRGFGQTCSEGSTSWMLRAHVSIVAYQYLMQLGPAADGVGAHLVRLRGDEHLTGENSPNDPYNLVLFQGAREAFGLA